MEIISSIEQGGYFGEKGLLKAAPSAYGAVAAMDLKCLVIERRAFEALLGPLQVLPSSLAE